MHARGVDRLLEQVQLDVNKNRSKKQAWDQPFSTMMAARTWQNHHTAVASTGFLVGTLRRP
jgi:hypothetical protein